MRADFETIVVSHHDDHILLVTLNRPETSNALNTRMGLDLMEVFETLSIDLEGLRVAIVTGSGDKAFCAGGDLKERNGMTDEAWRSQHLVFERMVRAMMGCPIPLLAAVNGAAYGGGCEIAAASDFIYAASTARFALTEITLGIMPGTGGNPEFSPGCWRTPCERAYSFGPCFHCTRGGSVGPRQPGGRARRPAADHTWNSPSHCRQRAARGAPGQAGRTSRAADVGMGRPRIRDRGLQSPGVDRRPAGRRARLQRASKAGFSRTVAVMRWCRGYGCGAVTIRSLVHSDAGNSVRCRASEFRSTISSISVSTPISRR
jgi:hypothetical protein